MAELDKVTVQKKTVYILTCPDNRAAVLIANKLEEDISAHKISVQEDGTVTLSFPLQVDPHMGGMDRDIFYAIKRAGYPF